jgi:hypothetical protein
VTGERGALAAHVAATDERNNTFGFELQSTDEGRRFVCKRHGNVSVITQRAAERVGLATGGSPLDNSGNSEKCRCISPLVRAGVW